MDWNRLRLSLTTIMAWLFALFFFSGSNVLLAQIECPFPDSLVVADTLDPSGYFPLEIGNSWDYLNSDGAFLEPPTRVTVVGDTLIEGIQFYKLKVIQYLNPNVQIYREGEVLTEAHVSFDFQSISQGILYSWSVVQGRIEVARLSNNFNTCYDDNNGITVRGEYSGVYMVANPTGEVVNIVLPALKSLLFFGAQEDIYGHGIGLIERTGDPSRVSRLVYSNTGGIEHGTALESRFDFRITSLEEHPVTDDIDFIQVYPNPTFSGAQFTFRLKTPKLISISLLDIHGRTLLEPIRNVKYPPGIHTGVLPIPKSTTSGVYFVQLVEDGYTVNTKKITILK